MKILTKTFDRYLKNYCNQKNIDFIDIGNLKEEHLGQKKLHLNKKGNSLLGISFLKFLRFNFWNNCTDSDCSRINNVEYIAELSEVNTKYVSFKSLKDIWIKNLNRIVSAHLNINSLRNKFDFLQIKLKVM